MKRTLQHCTDCHKEIPLTKYRYRDTDLHFCDRWCLRRYEFNHETRYGMNNFKKPTSSSKLL